MCIEKRVSWGGKISTIWEFCQEVKINFYIKQIENVFCSFEVSYFHDIFCLLKGEFHSLKGLINKIGESNIKIKKIE